MPGGFGFLVPSVYAGGGTWTFTDNLITARYSHTATLLPDGRVLVAASYGDSGPRTNSEIYNPATGTWSNTTGNMITARRRHTATLLPNNRVLVAGGQGIGTPTLNSAELYQPLTYVPIFQLLED